MDPDWFSFRTAGGPVTLTVVPTPGLRGRVELFGMAAAVENLSPDAATIIDGAAHVLRGRRLETVR